MALGCLWASSVAGFGREVMQSCRRILDPTNTQWPGMCPGSPVKSYYSKRYTLCYTAWGIRIPNDCVFQKVKVNRLLTYSQKVYRLCDTLHDQRKDHIMATGQHIGYVRVSTAEQSTDRQLDGIRLDRTFEDKVCPFGKPV